MIIYYDDNQLSVVIIDYHRGFSQNSVLIEIIDYH